MVIAILLLIATAAAAAGLLRWSRIPGAGVLGGVLAGLLLGPTIAGRLAPHSWERAFVGGQAERQARDAIIARRDADAMAGASTGRDATPLLAGTDEALIAARRDWTRATWTHQTPLRWTALLVAAAALLLAGGAAVPRDGPRPAIAVVASIAAWSVGAPAAVAVAILRLAPDLDAAQVTLAAAAVMIGPFVLIGADRDAAEAAELGGARLIQSAGRVASVIAIGATFVGMVLADAPAWAATTLLALPAGWIARRLLAFDGLRDLVLVPALAACVAVKVDALHDLAIWPLVALLLASGDGRWVGATIGAMLTGGRRWLRTMRLVMGSMACGPTQLALAAVALHTRAIPPSLGLAILAGAVLIELSTPMRRRMAARLAELEGLRP